MIAKAPERGRRGQDTAGLLGYLFGPGRANEHQDPHLVAAWDPEWLPGGASAERQRGWLARLGREVDAAMTGHEVEVPGGHVYHVVLSVPKQDRALGDARWRELVEDAVGRMGFGPDEEGRGGCRWVAVHHGPSKEGNDHVHLVVNLVRGDGRIADTYRDWPRWRQWCLDVEARLGLTPTSPANRTAPRRPSRAETEKSRRVGIDTTSREFLRDAVRQAAVASGSATEFLSLLAARSIQVVPRWGGAGQFAGYRVALRHDRSRSSPDGLVWFGGSQLARDLSAPKLAQRWTEAARSVDGGWGHHAERQAAVADATASIKRACTTLTTARMAGAADEADGIACAVFDLVVATAGTLESSSRRPLKDAAQHYERAAAIPYVVQPSTWGPIAAELRLAARRLIRLETVSRRGKDGVAVAALLVALAGLLAEVAAWREQAGQLRQAAAARRAAQLVNSDVPRRPAPRQPEPVAAAQPTPQRSPRNALPVRPRISGSPPIVPGSGRSR